jgi:hypothetical protein
VSKTSGHVFHFCLFIRFIFPNFLLSLLPILNSPAIPASAFLIKFKGTFGDLRR